MRAFPFLLACLLGGLAGCLPADEQGSLPEPPESPETVAGDQDAYHSAARLTETIASYRVKLAQAYVARGRLFHARGRHDEAVSDFTRAIEANPGCSRAYLERARACTAKGEYDTGYLLFPPAVEKAALGDAYNRWLYAPESRFPRLPPPTSEWELPPPTLEGKLPPPTLEWESGATPPSGYRDLPRVPESIDRGMMFDAWPHRPGK